MKTLQLKLQKEQMKTFKKELGKEKFSLLKNVVSYFNSIDDVMYGEELSLYVDNNFKNK